MILVWNIILIVLCDVFCDVLSNAWCYDWDAVSNVISSYLTLYCLFIHERWKEDERDWWQCQVSFRCIVVCGIWDTTLPIPMLPYPEHLQYDTPKGTSCCSSLSRERNMHMKNKQTPKILTPLMPDIHLSMIWVLFWCDSAKEFITVATAVECLNSDHFSLRFLLSAITSDLALVSGNDKTAL